MGQCLQSLTEVSAGQEQGDSHTPDTQVVVLRATRGAALAAPAVVRATVERRILTG